jgi:hypothetical protein
MEKRAGWIRKIYVLNIIVITLAYGMEISYVVKYADRGRPILVLLN